ncbi:Monocarboxylate transporter 7 [Lasiodiplodia hormozganensis]|uniref:Monocarboxylate transporter 7 n=1 Tax=Lasiodiplodia hormozganensis TaxID=869390 RepID=A0AA40CLG4_9PEZI|nr:Monocarboxylate transporter 7 [Lasiodiplodia hormozganensis]
METPRDIALESLDQRSLTASRLSSTTSREPSSNRKAVLVAMASFMVTFTGCGLTFAFGVYQELYESLEGPFANASPATIDLIGTLAVSLMTMGAPFASAWTKAYSPRTVTLIGGVIFALGNVLASFSQQLWHFIFTQGIILGIGTCLSYIPAVTVAPGWFNEKRALAMGVVLSGTGVGGVFWAPVIRLLNESIGFRHALQLTGGVAFLLISAAGMILSWDAESERRIALERQTRSSRTGAFQVPLVNWRVARSKKFLAHALSALFQAAAYYGPIYFLSAYARTLGYSAAAGANLIAISNASSAGGKVVLGYVADRFGRLNTLFLCTLVSTFITLGLWLPSTLLGPNTASKALFITFAITYGIFAGAYVSLFPTSLMEVFGAQNFASVNGFLYMARGCGALLGTPITGSLVRNGKVGSGVALGSPLGYRNSCTMVGALLAAATVTSLWLRLEAAGISKFRA